jgi:hypothetical protein
LSSGAGNSEAEVEPEVKPFITVGDVAYRVRPLDLDIGAEEIYPGRAGRPANMRHPSGQLRDKRGSRRQLLSWLRLL